MPGRQMEGDNRYRRRKAREAHKRGHLPSDEAVTLGASKQRHHMQQDDPHVQKLETIREGKQKVISKARPEPRPGSRAA
ncbi:MAG: hypothetical protein HY703_00415 [Gemmatimonadetes bacterium]|nr:hypothetical protein [Gemmatimonadota bacterium]